MSSNTLVWIRIRVVKNRLVFDSMGTVFIIILKMKSNSKIQMNEKLKLEWN
jgi:hypothetical protein